MKCIIKSVTKLWSEYFDNNCTLSKQSLIDLKEHLEDVESPQLSSAIDLVTDARLWDLVPLVAKFLDHGNSYIREITISCLLTHLHCDQYAEKVFSMILSDSYKCVQCSGLRSIGAVLESLPQPLQQKIAQYLYNIIVDQNVDKRFRINAYSSVNHAMNIPTPQQRSLGMKNFDRQIDYDFIESFCKKYNVKKFS